LVFVTASDLKEARSIAQVVVKTKRAACVNIVPFVTSFFRWKGKVQKSREALLIMKTTRAQYSGLEKAVCAIHSYEVPEIVSIQIERGLPQYMGWVRHETTSN
jgi:periplasmic divalent cation tolerance protein